ncbi:MAG TPA: ATP-binding protein, partial [Symbiobacteriaceae bacterium]|nr:ATP-binding protein [Symbiobacteriaceae bacterium]
RSSSQANLAQVGEALSLERNRILAQYRVEQAALEIDWDCPRCQNSGWLPAEIARPASPGEPETYYPPEKCQCLKREEMDDFFRAAGLQGPQQERTFDSFTLEVYPEERRQSVARVVHRCRDFTDGVIAGTQRESLVVLGHPGVGKTHLACAVAHEVIAARCTTVYLTMNDFLEIARIRTLDLTEDNRDYLRGILNADLLVLDDLGAEKVTDYSLQELMMMLNHRLNSGLPMLVTSNLSEEEIKQYYGDRIHSRLMNGCDVLYLAGDVDVRYKLRRRADR